MSREQLLNELRQQLQAIEDGSYRAPGSNNHQAPVPSQVQESHAASSSAHAVSDSEQSDAFKKIVALVNASDKSERAIRERLSTCGFQPEAIETAIDRAKTYRIIDDARFAETLVRSRLAQGKGRAGIERELRNHDIEIGAELSDILQEFNFEDHDDELERALHVLEVKPPRSKNLREGAFRKLVQKGYSTSIASSAARLWVERQR